MNVAVAALAVLAASLGLPLLPPDPAGRPADAAVVGPEWISAASGGTDPQEDSGDPSVSEDGRLVAFTSRSALLGPSVFNHADHVYVRDRLNGTITWVDSGPSRAGEGSGTATGPDISVDGQFVVFGANGPDLPSTPSGGSGLYLLDRLAGTTTPIVTFADPTTGLQTHADVAGGAQVVTFLAPAGLDATVTGSGSGDQVYLWTKASQAITQLSKTPAGTQPNGASQTPHVASFGTRVFFTSTATDLVAGMTLRPRHAGGDRRDVYGTDFTTGQTVLVSSRQPGVALDQPSYLNGKDPVSVDGQDLAFVTQVDVAATLGPPVVVDRNGAGPTGEDIVTARDLNGGGILTTFGIRALASRGLASANHSCSGRSNSASILGTGDTVVFGSTCGELVDPTDVDAAPGLNFFRVSRDGSQGRPELLSTTTAGTPLNDPGEGAIPSAPAAVTVNGGVVVYPVSRGVEAMPGDTSTADRDVLAVTVTLPHPGDAPVATVNPGVTDFAQLASLCPSGTRGFGASLTGPTTTLVDPQSEFPSVAFTDEPAHQLIRFAEPTPGAPVRSLAVLYDDGTLSPPASSVGVLYDLGDPGKTVEVVGYPSPNTQSARAAVVCFDDPNALPAPQPVSVTNVSGPVGAAKHCPSGTIGRAAGANGGTATILDPATGTTTHTVANGAEQGAGNTVALTIQPGAPPVRAVVGIYTEPAGSPTNPSPWIWDFGSFRTQDAVLDRPPLDNELGAFAFAVCVPLVGPELVSRSGPGNVANGSSTAPAISDGGDLVAFTSAATNLVANGPTDGTSRLYLKNRITGQLDVIHGEDNRRVQFSDLSGDGQWLVFLLDAIDGFGGGFAPDGRRGPRDGLVGHTDVVRRNVGTGAEEILATLPQIEGRGVAVSDDGSRVVAVTETPLSPSSAGANSGVYAFKNGTWSPVSRPVADVDPDGRSEFASLSGNGRYAVFTSRATNLVPGLQLQSRHTPDGFDAADVYRTDLDTGTVELVSGSVPGGTQTLDGFGNRTDGSRHAISDDGQQVVFTARVGAQNFDPSVTDRNGDLGEDAILADFGGGSQESFVPTTGAGPVRSPQASGGSGPSFRVLSTFGPAFGSLGNIETCPSFSGVAPSISGDGQTVTFLTACPDYFHNPNGKVFPVWSRNGSPLHPVSTTPSGEQDGIDPGNGGNSPVLSKDGHNLVWDVFGVYRLEDQNNQFDVYGVGTPVLGDTVPDAVDDTATAVNGVATDLDVLANDLRFDPATLTVLSVSAGTATVVDTPGGKRIRYTSPVGFAGPASVVYRIADGDGDTDTATVLVDVPLSAPPLDPDPVLHSADGAPVVEAGGSNPTVSKDGTFIAYVGIDANTGATAIFRRPAVGGPAVRIDVSGSQPGLLATFPDLSADGRFVVFRASSDVTHQLVPGVPANTTHYYWKDLQTGEVRLVDHTAGGAAGASLDFGTPRRPSISGDGQTVVFDSNDPNLDGPGHPEGEVYRWRASDSSVTKISEAADGTAGDRGSIQPIISADGNVVVFLTLSTNLVPGIFDPNNNPFLSGYDEVAVDLTTGVRSYLTAPGGAAQGGAITGGQDSVSADGTKVLINLQGSLFPFVPGVNDGGGARNLVLFDRTAGTYQVVDSPLGGADPCPFDADVVGASGQSYTGALSGDGTTVLFTATCDEMSGVENSDGTDVYRWRPGQRPALVSHTVPGGAPSNQKSGSAPRVFDPAISADGQVFVFDSSTDLTAGEAPSQFDVYTVGTPTPPDPVPDAVDDSSDAVTGFARDIDVLTNDLRFDPATLTVQSVDTGTAIVVDTPGGKRVRYSSPPGFTGTAHVVYQIADDNGDTDTATVTVTVVPVVATPLTLDIVPTNGGNVLAGTPATERITATNNTGSTLLSGRFTVRADLPGSITAASPVDPAWQCTVAGDQRSVTCERGTAMAPGEASAGVDFTVLTPPGPQLACDPNQFPPGQLCLVVHGWNGSLADEVVAVPAPIEERLPVTGDIVSVVSVDSSPYPQFGQGTARVNFATTSGGTGGTPVTVRMRSTQPDMTFVSGAGGGWSCVPDGSDPQSGLCSLAAYPAFPQPVPSIDAVFNVGGGTALGCGSVPAPCAILDVFWEPTVPGAPALRLFQDVNEVLTAPGDNPDLSVKMTHSEPAKAGTKVDFVAQVANVGTGPTNGVTTLAVQLPPKFTPLSASGSGWTCSVDAGTRLAICERGDVLAPNALVPSITVVAQLDSDASSGAAVATVDTPGDPAPGGPPGTGTVPPGTGTVPPGTNTANNSFNDPVDVVPITSGPDGYPALGIEVDGPLRLSRGQTVGVTAHVQNNGDLPTQGPTTVRVILPDGQPAGQKLSGVARGDRWTCAVIRLRGSSQLQCTHPDGVGPHGGQLPDLLVDVTAVDVPDKGTVDLPFTLAPTGSNTRRVHRFELQPPQPARLDVGVKSVGPLLAGKTATVTVDVVDSGLGPTAGPLTVDVPSLPGLTHHQGHGSQVDLHARCGRGPLPQRRPAQVGDGGRGAGRRVLGAGRRCA